MKSKVSSLNYFPQKMIIIADHADADIDVWICCFNTLNNNNKYNIKMFKALILAVLLVGNNLLYYV